MPVKRKPQNKNNTKVYEKTLKLGEGFEDPNDCVGAEETTNLGSDDWEQWQLLPEQLLHYPGMIISAISYKMNTFMLFIYVYYLLFFSILNSSHHAKW